jgi:signal transduction histidine kinase
MQEGMYFLESRCTKEGIKLVRRLQEDLPDVMADPSQLHQVLVNLVVNAIQAMPRGGTLTLATRADTGRACLMVEDTGVGMSAEVMEQLFMPFFTTKEVGEGTGLGLAVVHGIVTAHKGVVKVNSEVGRGSTFEVCLPTDDSGSPIAGKGPGEEGS